MEQGWVFVALRQYAAGKLSLGSLSRRLGVPLADALDLLAELGIRAPIPYEDYRRSLETARKLLGGKRR